MPKNSQKIGEANFKAAIFQEYFGAKRFTYMQEVSKIDFVITDKAERHILWAETKKDTADIIEMFVQLILTIGKNRIYDEYTPPPFLGVFDYNKIAFIQYYILNEVFGQNDFNWNVTPSDHKTKEFVQLKKIIKETIEENELLFSFDNDKQDINEFIKNNFVNIIKLNPDLVVKTQIDKNNFISIYNRWLEIVKPSIAIDWEMAKKAGIMDGYFYLADLLSIENVSFHDKLLIILQNNYYKFAKGEDEYGISLYGEIQFKDNQKKHKEFWNRYKRPHDKCYWEFMIERSDLLVPQDIRERKGSFFTPQKWVRKSQAYLAKAFGVNWQDEYYIWDCAAGTGNLLVGLINTYNVWASTIDKQDVGVMYERIRNGAHLLESHVFQFDFLNDSFEKLPEELKKIIDDPVKRKKLIIYINPPYAETMSKGEKHKAGVNISKVNADYSLQMGNCANRELFIQFLTRIYFEIPDCFICTFSTLKSLNAPNFDIFRSSFKAKLKSLFVVPAYTFDNVKGKFPIGFQIWDTSIKQKFKKIKADVFDENENNLGKKTFTNYDDVQLINEWIIATRNRKNEKNIGFMACLGNDFQQNNVNYIMSDKSQMASPRGSWITDKNLKEAAVYYAVRHCISATWLNDRDQFLYPGSEWEKDSDFHNDCLIFTLFNNRITSSIGINHWIPFTAQDVNAKDNFESNFMSNYLKGRKLGKEARDSLKAGKELWKYYHAKINKNNKTKNNASYYDIKEFFQGRSEKSRMKIKSDDDQYNALINTLRANLSALKEKIKPKVYEYGFLEE